MGKPAARVGDKSTPPHTPGLLAPGPGSTNVFIGGKPAWRSHVDLAMCMLPIAPPSPVPHGPERCYLGSLSVMINGKMAVRQGDSLIGAGPPNPVMTGDSSVLIGDMGFGLANPINAAEFCTDFEKLESDWSTLSDVEREQSIEAITNKQLSKSGVPALSITSTKKYSPGKVLYNYFNDKLIVSQSQMNVKNLSSKEAKQLAKSIYREARRAEQWFLIVQSNAQKRVGVEKLLDLLNVSLGLINAGSILSKIIDGAQSTLANVSFDSIYGAGGENRSDVLSNKEEKLEEYYALPEEQDARNTADSLPFG